MTRIQGALGAHMSPRRGLIHYTRPLEEEEHLCHKRRDRGTRRKVGNVEWATHALETKQGTDPRAPEPG